MGYADFLLYRTNMNAFLRLAMHCHRSVLALADFPSIQVVVSKQLQWGQEGPVPGAAPFSLQEIPGG